MNTDTYQDPLEVLRNSSIDQLNLHILNLTDKLGEDHVFTQYAVTQRNMKKHCVNHPDWVEPDGDFEEWSDADKKAFFENSYYHHVRKLADGTWAGILELAYTAAICTDLNDDSQFHYRWCFKDRDMAITELDKMQSYDTIPTLGSFVAHRSVGKPLWVDPTRSSW